MTETATVEIPLRWSAVATPNPPDETYDPQVDRYLQRTSVTMPAPTLVNGRPRQPWQPTIDRSNWRRLRLHVGGKNLTKVRGKRFLPLTERLTEPFGYAEGAFALPGVTEFDDPLDFGLRRLAPMRIIGIDPDGNKHTEYEGEIASWEPDDGYGLVVHCLGVFYRNQLLRVPPALIQTEQDLGDIIPRVVNKWRRQYALHLGHMRHVKTGITDVPGGDFSNGIDQIQTWLSKMTDDDGDQYTIKIIDPRTPKLVKKDSVTVHATITYGQPGAKVRASVDHTSATTGVFATGSNGHCSWMGARFPHQEQQDVPAFPLSVGATFVAGDGQTGFAEFAAYLRRGQYGTIVSDDTYDPRDVDNVKQFQDRADITVDGIVGAQTWEAAFLPALAGGSVLGGYVGTIAEKAATRKRKDNAQGADVGRNSHFDPHVPRIEDYVPMGDNVSKNLGRKSGQQIIDRNYPAGRVGDIEFTLDPEGRSRWSIRDGMNILIKHFAGSNVLVHVIDVNRDRRTGTVSVTIDEKSRDLLTAAAIHQRHRELADLTRRVAPTRTRAKQFDEYGQWLCEDGAGDIPLMNQQAGLWNTQPISAAPKGVIARIALALGSGLTEHLLNQALSDHPPASISGATRGAILITTKPITPNQIAGMAGMSTPLHVMGDGTNPWDFNENRLNRFGKIFAAGGPADGIGFYPKDNDAGDGSIAPTGLFEDGGGVDFGPTGRYKLWISIWTEASCKVGGRIYPAPLN